MENEIKETPSALSIGVVASFAYLCFVWTPIVALVAVVLGTIEIFCRIVFDVRPETKQLPRKGRK